MKNRHLRFYLIFFVLLTSIVFSSCAKDDNSANSMVMVKNSQMSSYGTGFCVGIAGKRASAIITAYSVIASANGAYPDKAEIYLSDSPDPVSVKVAYCDAKRNAAVLMLPDDINIDEIPNSLIISADENVDFDKEVTAFGCKGTGNIMSDFEKYNSEDIMQYNGYISESRSYNGYDVYLFNTEFDKGFSGGPVLNGSGNIMGICAFVTGKDESDFSQYILPSEVIIECMDYAGIPYMNSQEVKIKNIIIISSIIGLLIFGAIILFGTAYLSKLGKLPNDKIETKNKINNKANNKNISTDNAVSNSDNSALRVRLKINGGTLKGGEYIIDGKISIGRDKNRCQVVYPVDEPGISAYHCSLYIRDNNCIIVDNGSSYGTYLENGMKLEPNKEYVLNNNSAFYPSQYSNIMQISYDTGGNNREY